ncbi:MAG: TIGR03960 family B12-binding radical SAM protein, partial [Clostridia bacterium]
FAMCFPDIYEIGMSNLGTKIIYDLLNKRDDTWCERVYAPWIDFEKVLRDNNKLLYGLESSDELNKFDFLGFTLQYELSFTNILNMIDMSNIPVFSKDRENDYPFIVCGGPCASNPYPLSIFVDIFLLGEGEEILNEIIDKYVIWKKSGLSKQEYLKSIKDIEGVFIPTIHTKNDVITKRIIEDMNTVIYPTDLVVPSTEILQNRISLEIFRGCKNGCRFCQAGYIYRPVREKNTDTLMNILDKSLTSTGTRNVSLSSLSTSDYSSLNELCYKIFDYRENKNLNVSLPSLRIDTVDLDVINKTDIKKSLTFAPEAGSQRLRDVINKNLSKEEIISSVKKAYLNGITSIKLYFMIGLPTETFADVADIVKLSNEIVELYYELPKELRKKRLSITVATSTFVPKAHTPFMWCKQDSEEQITMKQNYLKEKLNNKCITYKWHNIKASKIEALIARGDTKVGYVIYTAWKNGAKFDSFDECLNYTAWEKALDRENIDISDYIYKEYDLDYNFCFDNINYMVDKEFLKSEYLKAMKNIRTDKCDVKCNNCGILKYTKCNLKRIKK